MAALSGSTKTGAGTASTTGASTSQVPSGCAWHKPSSHLRSFSFITRRQEPAKVDAPGRSLRY
ncbi:hypothetical protein GCM10009416_48560 [Craurococcus roseus]|uniref:Uncharacterized protein n=1 Tax=Craurococcus roseus TaxID=77585 RepID=A0ABN1G759_9PROT